MQCSSQKAHVLQLTDSAWHAHRSPLPLGRGMRLRCHGCPRNAGDPSIQSPILRSAFVPPSVLASSRDCRRASFRMQRSPWQTDVLRAFSPQASSSHFAWMSFFPTAPLPRNFVRDMVILSTSSISALLYLPTPSRADHLLLSAVGQRQGHTSR